MKDSPIPSNAVRRHPRVLDGIFGQKCHYDGDGKLCASRNWVFGGNMTQYLYDAEGSRVGKGTIQDWTKGCDVSQNGFALSNEYVPSQAGDTLTEFTWQGTTESWDHTDVSAAGMLVATFKTDGPHYQLTDWLGTRRVQMNAQAAAELSCFNNPFGENPDGGNASECISLSANSIDATEKHFTEKERDAESGLDNFGARYFASTTGRMLSPDLGNLGASRTNPQTWNMYSYALNNPLGVTDPTGMYVCEDSVNCDSQNDKKFAQSLADAQTAANNLTGDGKIAAQRAIDAYGAMGVDNGVNVRFDSTFQGGVTEVGGVANGDKSTNNQNGQNINVTFNPNDVGGDFSGGLVGHEGSHVADASAWVASGFSPNSNPTNFTAEFNAYRSSFDIGNELLNMKAGPGGDYTGFIQVPPNGQVNWKKGDTFKAITPDLQQMIRENYKNLNSPAFTKGGVLQP